MNNVKKAQIRNKGTTRDAPHLSLYYRKKCVPKQERPLVASYDEKEELLSNL